jgi:uncharacterized protein YecE (DUF72 family)
MKKTTIHIGTSGWHYKHWRGTFYPATIKDKERFSYYSKEFSTVELNNPFYHLPEAATFRMWRKESPPGFIFAVKASRYITHMKKLAADKESVMLFLKRAANLKEKLGPILFQLPPHWQINVERLATFLHLLPKKYLYTFEFRNPTWYTQEVYDLLQAHNCAFCIYELAGHQSPLQVTADFVYVRLHGPGNKYQGSYPNRTLKKWAGLCNQWKKSRKRVYIYFDNDQAGYAAFNAKTLLELL